MASRCWGTPGGGRYALLALGIAAAFTGCRENRTSEQPVVTTTAEGASVAPSRDAARRRDVALVRVINAVPDGGFDIWADSRKAFTNTRYRQVTPYREFEENEVTFTVRPAGTDTMNRPLASNTELTRDGSYHTVVLIPNERDRTPELRALGDDVKPPQAGMARVRVVHAAPGLGPVDVFASDSVAPDTAAEDSAEPVFDHVQYMAEEGYKDIRPIAGPIEVRADGERMVLATVDAARLEAGRSYTIVIAGPRAGKSTLDAIIVADEVGTADSVPDEADP